MVFMVVVNYLNPTLKIIQRHEGLELKSFLINRISLSYLVIT
jgi:hypothetical protein